MSSHADVPEDRGLPENGTSPDGVNEIVSKTSSVVGESPVTSPRLESSGNAEVDESVPLCIDDNSSPQETPPICLSW